MTYLEFTLSENVFNIFNPAGNLNNRLSFTEVTDFFKQLFDTAGFPPRWHCGKWTDFHGWFYIISDLLIWSAYFSIPFIIINYVSKRSELRFPKMYFLFAAFILACGLTHLIDAVIFWYPFYRFSALVRFITAILSLLTVYNLIKILPVAFSLKTEKQLEEEVIQRKKAEEELLSKSSELQAINAELQRFAYVASHDLQAPLRKIRGFIDRLQQFEKDNVKVEERQLLEEKIVKSTELMQQLIADILNFSRMNADSSQFKKTDLNEILKIVLSDLEGLVDNNQLLIKADTLPVIEANTTQMVQLFQNLILNSIKFKKAGTVAEIQIHLQILKGTDITLPSTIKTHYQFSVADEKKYWQDESFCKITFSDNGIGFDTKYAERIFQPFERLNGKSDYEGSGLGLAICKKIVTHHQGLISAQSGPGKGTTFTVVLPLLQTAKETLKEVHQN
jgi:chemotaxis family two-component system sensor kinase Cph1